MCGISLVIDPVGGRTDVSIVERMTAAIKHRGPDGASFESLNNCYMGHARLSIIDLDTGTQPMADSSNRYWIVFNGEIYNYRELRAELAKLGARFATNSDTEVVIQSFIVWGDLCVDHLRGMFAFAIWDTLTNQLFAARDLFGEKPLYYAVTDDGRFLICSEIKGLLASGLLSPVINAESIDSYLTFGYISPDRTVYSGIETLPAGCWLRWNKKITALTRYWAPKFEERPITIEDATSEFRFLLERAVKRQMVSDVPIGAFLSGGLDSSTIVALMQQQSSGKIKTFSAGFGDQINELPYARAVANKFDTDHYELDFGSPDVAELLVQMSQIYDEPFADTSNIPTFLISKFARDHVKVVMGGDGGDETLGGYWWYPPLAESEHIRGSWTKWLLLRILAKVASAKSDIQRKAVATGWATRYPDIWSRDIRAHVVFNESERRKLWENSDLYDRMYSPGDRYKPCDSVNGLNRGMYFDQTFYLPGDILVKVDRAAMANGLETRSPFLDRDLVEFLQLLPPRLKVNKDETKVLLRMACSSLWPNELKNRNKQGFGAPSAHWLKRADVTSLSRRISGNNSYLRELLPGTSFPSGDKQPYQSWILLVLGLWLETWQVAI